MRRMRFVHRVRNVWSWLPAFRAVAETEHLPTAATELGVVASSLSRTVKQIEDELGVPLFERASKALVLNQAGRTLVGAVREAMRIIDDALGSAVGDDLRGTLGVVADSDLVHGVLIPAAALLAASQPSLVLATAIARADQVADLLLRGDADAAVLGQQIPAHPDLRVTELASWTRGVYARGSPATRYRCVVVGSPTEPIDDGWPADCERQVVAWVPDELAALELCARTELATAAHDGTVRRGGFEARLIRHDLAIAPRPVYLAQRRAVGRHPRTEVLVEAIRAAIAAA